MNWAVLSLSTLLFISSPSIHAAPVSQSRSITVDQPTPFQNTPLPPPVFHFLDAKPFPFTQTTLKPKPNPKPNTENLDLLTDLALELEDQKWGIGIAVDADDSEMRSYSPFRMVNKGMVYGRKRKGRDGLDDTSTRGSRFEYYGAKGMDVDETTDDVDDDDDEVQMTMRNALLREIALSRMRKVEPGDEATSRFRPRRLAKAYSL